MQKKKVTKMHQFKNAIDELAGVYNINYTSHKLIECILYIIQLRRGGGMLPIVNINHG